MAATACVRVCVCVCVSERERWGWIGGDKGEDHVDPAPRWDTNPSLWLVKTPPHGRAQHAHARTNPHATSYTPEEREGMRGRITWFSLAVPELVVSISSHLISLIDWNPTHTHSGERERGKLWWDSWYRGPWGEQNESLSFLLAVIRMRSLPCAKGLSLLGDHKMPPERFIFHSQNPLQHFTHIQEMRG